MNTRTTIAAIALSIASTGFAQTSEVTPNVFRVESGVSFELNNLGASSFLFNWTDSSGSVVDEEDPTLILTAGEIYTFRRLTGSHPFVITDDTLPVTGTDGSYSRDTFDGAVIDAATLNPIADFTADPGPTKDMIEWTLTAEEIGDYFYTCRVISHLDMAGRIEVVAAPCPGDITGDGEADFLDISFFLSEMFDFNGDTDFDFLDISAFIQAYTAGCP